MGRGEPRPRFKKPPRSEDELQAQLNRAAATGADNGVGSGDVWSGTAATETTGGRIIQSESVLASIRIGEVGMVEDVEEFSPELGTEALAEMPVLCQREVHISESGIGEGVAAHVA